MSKKQITGISIVVALIAIFIGVKMYAANVAEAKVNKAIEKVANFVDIDYKNVSIDLIGMDVRVSGILVSPADAKEKIKIDEIVVYDIDDKSDLPAYLSMACNGIELNIKDLGEDARQLVELGYTDKLMVNVSADYFYDKEKKELDMKKLSIGADDVGKIILSFRLGNISLEPKELAGLLFTFPQLIFHEAKIEYNDDTLAERFIKLGAKEQQVSPEEFRKFLIENVETEIEQEKDEFVQNALKEVKEFLSDPKEFSISLSPPKPQPLGRIMRANDPKDMIKLLNIRIKS